MAHQKAVRLVGYMAASTLFLLAVLAAWLYPPNTVELETTDLPQPCVIALERMSRSNSSNGANCEVRLWYQQQLSVLPELDALLLAREVPMETRALCAYEVRRQARLQARLQMDSVVDVMMLRLRDLLKYGHPDGPGFDQLVSSNQAKTDPYGAIIDSARRARIDPVPDCERGAEMLRSLTLVLPQPPTSQQF